MKNLVLAVEERLKMRQCKTSDKRTYRSYQVKQSRYAGKTINYLDATKCQNFVLNI